MSAVLALGVFGGLVGARWRRACGGRCAGGVGDFAGRLHRTLAGDAWFGLFVAVPGQIAVLSMGVLIALGYWHEPGTRSAAAARAAMQVDIGLTESRR